MKLQMSILRKENNDNHQLNFLSIQMDDDEKYFWTNQVNFTHVGFNDFCKKELQQQFEQNNIQSQLILFFIENLESTEKFIYDLTNDYAIHFDNEKVYIDFCEREFNFIHWHNFAKDKKCAYKDKQISIPDLNNFTGFDQ